jgi:aminopeptidase N
MNSSIKNKIQSISILLLIAGNIVAQSPQNIDMPLPIQHTRATIIDIKHISLRLQFDWEKKQAFGVATIDLNTLVACDNFSLDAGMLSIHSIKLSSGKVLKFMYNGGDEMDGLKINLDKVYQPNENIKIEINYRTTYQNPTDPNNLGFNYGKGLRFFQPTSTDTRKRKQIWSASIPEGNKYWYPCVERIEDRRTTELFATVEKKLTVVSNGILKSVKENTDGTHTFHWKMDKPYSNHQTSIVVGEYTDLKQNFKGIEIHNFSYPDEVEAVKASTVRLIDMIKFFAEKTKIKFPYPNYNQVFVQEYPWGGGHNMNTSTLSDNMVDDEGTHKDFIYLWDWVEGNDVAAQWFGNLVTPKSWEHSWLNKSFAVYFSTLYNEYKNGNEDFQIYNRGQVDLPTIIGDWNGGYRRPLVANKFDDVNSIILDNYALSRGPQVLHMLRKHLGDAIWWKAINIYLTANANKLVETKDFQNAVEQACGYEMQWFFDQWVYKIGLSVFEVSKKYDAAKKQMVISLKQTQIADTTTTYLKQLYFKGKMEIAIDNKITEVWIEDKEENVFAIPVIKEPNLLNIDFGNRWIKEIKFEKTTDEYIYQLKNEVDITARMFALQQLSTIISNDKIEQSEKQKIIIAFQDLADSKSFWRLRQFALAQLRKNLAPNFDSRTIAILLKIINTESSWLKSTAVGVLGFANNAQYADIFEQSLNDKSDRVRFAAATALAKTKKPGTFKILEYLISKPSWKNQSLMHALRAMQVLKDSAAVPIALNALEDDPALPRWTLANGSWDYRVVAAETLVTFGKGNLGFPIVLSRFKKSMEENDVNDIFNNVMLVAILGDPRGQEVFDFVKVKFKDDANAMVAVNGYEEQFKEAIKK